MKCLAQAFSVERRGKGACSLCDSLRNEILDTGMNFVALLIQPF